MLDELVVLLDAAESAEASWANASSKLFSALVPDAEDCLLACSVCSKASNSLELVIAEMPTGFPRTSVP